MGAARQVSSRYRARGSELDPVFGRAAGDLGRLLSCMPAGPAAAALTESLARNPSGWKAWLPSLLAEAPRAVAEDALRFLAERRGVVPGWITLVRQLADAASDVDAFRATWPAEALLTPSVAAEVARRLLGAGRFEEAGEVLRAAAPKPPGRPQVDADWESVWIDHLDAAGRPDEAQAVRWAAFERSLSVDRARAFISRLADFDDVDAESRAFAVAAQFPDFEAGLRFLMEWPSVVEAARMIQRRSDEIQVSPEAAELWSAKLRSRQPRAAHMLLRRGAAAAFRRRDFKTCERLTQEADTIDS